MTDEVEDPDSIGRAKLPPPRRVGSRKRLIRETVGPLVVVALLILVCTGVSPSLGEPFDGSSSTELSPEALLQASERHLHQGDVHLAAYYLQLLLTHYPLSPSGKTAFQNATRSPMKAQCRLLHPDYLLLLGSVLTSGRTGR